MAAQVCSLWLTCSAPCHHYCCSQPYLTETGAESLGHAHFLSGVNLPSSDGKPHPLVPQVAPPPMEHWLKGGGSPPPVEDWLKGGGLPPPVEHWLKGGGSLAQAFGGGLSRLLVYQQTLADSYQGTYCRSASVCTCIYVSL